MLYSTGSVARNMPYPRLVNWWSWYDIIINNFVLFTLLIDRLGMEVFEAIVHGYVHEGTPSNLFVLFNALTHLARNCNQYDPKIMGTNSEIQTAKVILSKVWSVTHQCLLFEVLTRIRNVLTGASLCWSWTSSLESTNTPHGPILSQGPLPCIFWWQELLLNCPLPNYWAPLRFIMLQ